MKRTMALLLAVCLLLGGVSALATAPEGAPLVTLHQNSGAGASTAGSEAGSTDAGYQMVQKKLYDETGVWVEAQLAPTQGAVE